MFRAGAAAGMINADGSGDSIPGACFEFLGGPISFSSDGTRVLAPNYTDFLTATVENLTAPGGSITRPARNR